MSAAAQFEVGQLVRYQGSKTERHGIYRVIALGNGNRLVLVPDGEVVTAQTVALTNVRPSSVFPYNESETP